MRPDTLIRNTFTTDYEGNPKAGAVKVPVRNVDVEVQDYDVVKGANLTTSATTYLDIPVSKNQVINELIDGYEAQAVPDNLIAQRLESGAYSIAKTLEDNALEVMTTEGNFTASSATGASTEATIYANILKDIAQLKKLGIKSNRIKVAIDSDVEVLLLTDEKFSNTAGTLGAELVREGVIGKIAGVATKPNYLMGEDVEFIIYDKRFCQKYEVWKKEPTVEDIKDGKHIGSSALQGRQVGGLMVTNALGVQIKKNA